jgi:hypothetical protein
MELPDTMRKRQLWVRTTPTAEAVRTADDGEVVGEPVSPSAKLLEDLYIVVTIGLASPANLSVLRAGISTSIACHPRFNTIQVVH